MNQFLASIPALAWLMPVIMLWGQIKSGAQNLIRLIIVEVKMDGSASRAITYYLAAKGKPLPSNIIRYDSLTEYVMKRKSNRTILMQILAGLKSQLFWTRGTLVSLSDLRGQDKETGMMNEMSCSLRFLRGTLDHEKLLCDAVEWYDDTYHQYDKEASQRSSRFFIRRYVGKGQLNGVELRKDSSGTAPSASTPSRLNESVAHNRLVNYSRSDIGYSKRDFFYTFNETTNRFRADVLRWFKSKEWYESKGLLFRRGCLLWGLAGSGKTAAIRKVAQEIDVPLFLFELNTMADHEFIEYWDNAISYGPCMIVFEDIDCSFNKRVNISKAGKLSFECLLNCVSGVVPSEGVYLCITTNRLDYLDEALGVPNERGVSTRPGRLDTCFEIGNIDEAQKRAMAVHFLAEHEDIIEDLIERSNGCTAAQFSDMCSQKALELHWRDK
jgi:hypothetical protein